MGARVIHHALMKQWARACGVLLLMAAGSVGFIALTPLSASSSCAPATVSVSPTTVKPNQPITIRGLNFACFATSSSGEAGSVHIDVQFVQGSTVIGVGAVDTSFNTFRLKTTIPRAARAGVARIEGVSKGIRASGAITVVTKGLAHTGAPTIEIWLVGSMMVLLGLFGLALDRIWA
jgi:hypothetical protein